MARQDFDDVHSLVLTEDISLKARHLQDELLFKRLLNFIVLPGYDYQSKIDRSVLWSPLMFI